MNGLCECLPSLSPALLPDEFWHLNCLAPPGARSGAGRDLNSHLPVREGDDMPRSAGGQCSVQSERNPRHPGSSHGGRTVR
jgi:hypothetical protein